MDVPLSSKVGGVSSGIHKRGNRSPGSSSTSSLLPTTTTTKLLEHNPDDEKYHKKTTKNKLLPLFGLLGILVLGFFIVSTLLQLLSSNGQKIDIDDELFSTRALQNLKSEIVNIPDQVRLNDIKKDIKDTFWSSDNNENVENLSLSPSCTELVNDNPDEFNRVCGTNYNCLLHEREYMPKSTTETTTNTCKTLWFAGFHEGYGSRCDNSGYRMDYAAALQSVLIHAKDVLQPILLLGRLGLTNDTDISAVRTWATERGAIVITVHQLSFQNDITNWHGNNGPYPTSIDHQLGPYLRMDIPWIIQKHNLFDLPNICSRYVLYTDADTLFVNPISHQDMDDLKSYMTERKYQPIQYNNRNFVPTIWERFWYRFYEPPFVMYGREKLINTRKPKNTGVMLIDIPRFQQELPKLLHFRNTHMESYYFKAFDQGWLNEYFMQSYRHKPLRHLLPIYWNWKLYWKIQPSIYNDIKIVHFHGPKPKTGAWYMADCITNLSGFWPPEYHGIIIDAICCDYGKTANKVRSFYKHIQPNPIDVC